MSLETGVYVGDLVPTNPPDTDPRSQGGAHLRLIKSLLQDSFPGVTKLIMGSGAAAGTASAMTLALTPAPTANTDLNLLLVKAVGANVVVNPTLQVNALAALTITREGGNPLLLGDIRGANHWLLLSYNGGTLDLLNPHNAFNGASSTISGNVTLTATTMSALSMVTASAIITLPVATAVAPFQPFAFKSTTFGDVTLAPNGTDQIEGVNASFRIPAYITLEIMSDGTKWWVLRGNENQVGAIKPFGGSAAPIGWNLCDASSLLRATYAGAFAVLGTTYGSADGTHFTLPDFQGRAIVGAGSGSGLTARALGNTGGEETHILSVPELPSHSHPAVSGNFYSSGAAVNMGTASPTPFFASNANTGSTGSGSGHNNMQPFGVANYIIKL